MTAADALRANIQARLDALQISISEAERRADIGKAVLSKFLADPDKAMALDVAERLAPALGTTLTELLGGVRATRQDIAPDQLHRSPLNPRKASGLDAGDIDDLARSIAAEGVLQNLIARPHPERPGDFEIVAGERRWRAACRAIEKGMVAPDFTVPVVVRDLTDDQLVEIALVENIKRENMSALEEADAIALLHDRARHDGKTKDFTKRLAEATGMSDRWVRKRVKLARDLLPEVRKMLEDGDIGVQMAMELSEVPAAAQSLAATNITKKMWGWENAEKLKVNLCGILPDVGAAIFDLAQYDGGFITLNNRKCFADGDQARRLQDAAVETKIAAIKADGGAVERVDHAYGWQAAAPGEKGTTLIIQRGFHVAMHENMVATPESDEDDDGDTEGGLRKKDAEERQAARAAWIDQVTFALRNDEAARLRAQIMTTVMADGGWPAAIAADDDVVFSMVRGLNVLPAEDEEGAPQNIYQLGENEFAAIRSALKTADLAMLRGWMERLVLTSELTNWQARNYASDNEAAVADLCGVELPACLIKPHEPEPDDEGGEAGEDPLPKCGVCGVTTEEDGSCSACGPRDEDEGEDADEPEDGEDPHTEGAAA